jgi:cell volume regulation protein A
MVPRFFWQAGAGLSAGWAMGRGFVWIVNRAKFTYDGFYMVFALAFGVFVYAATDALKASGFLAVYVSAIVIGNHSFVQKRSVTRFYDGLTWLAQIGMFLTLGLLVTPSRLVPVIGDGLLVSGFLMLAARPLATFLCLAPTGWNLQEKLFLSWVGLRGAVPIVLATFLLVARFPQAELLFNLVFFIVLTSAMLQGWSIPWAARLLGVSAPAERARPKPLEFTAPEGSNTELEEFIVPFNSAAAGRSIAQLSLPAESLVVLMGRGDSFLVPHGGSILEEGDTLMVLVSPETKAALQALLSQQRPPSETKPNGVEPSAWFG